MPILLHFVKPKHPSGNCWVKCFLTYRTALIWNMNMARIFITSTTISTIQAIYFRVSDILLAVCQQYSIGQSTLIFNKEPLKPEGHGLHGQLCKVFKVWKRRPNQTCSAYLQYMQGWELGSEVYPQTIKNRSIWVNILLHFPRACCNCTILPKRSSLAEYNSGLLKVLYDSKLISNHTLWALRFSYSKEALINLYSICIF